MLPIILPVQIEIDNPVQMQILSTHYKRHGHCEHSAAISRQVGSSRTEARLSGAGLVKIASLRSQ